MTAVIDPGELGFCAQCGQDLIRTATDCWHPVEVEYDCPPTQMVNGISRVVWGDGFDRPGRDNWRGPTVPIVPIDPRPSWDQYGLDIARVVATRADCTRRQVGAVIIDASHSVIATGYNGAPAGQPGCLTAGACPRGQSGVMPGSSYDTGAGSCIAIHAEANALLRAGTSSRGATLYVTDKPCDGCARLVAGAGIARTVYP